MEIEITSTEASSYNVVLLLNPDEKTTIKTTVTNDVDVALNWVYDAALYWMNCFFRFPSFGLDLQCYRHLSTSKPKPAILTLSHSNCCLILQLCHISPDKEEIIKELLYPVKRFVGVNVKRSAAILKEEYGVDVDDEKFEEISGNFTGGRGGGGVWFEKYGEKLMKHLMIMRKKTTEIELGAVWEIESLDQDLIAYVTLESYLYYMFAEGYKYLKPFSLVIGL